MNLFKHSIKTRFGECNIVYVSTNLPSESTSTTNHPNPNGGNSISGNS